MKIYPANKNGKDGWICDWTDSEGKRYRPFFTAKATAEKYASTLKSDAKVIGEKFAALEPWEKVLAAQGYLRAKDAGYSLIEACEYFEAQKNKGATVTVADLCSRHTAAKTAKGIRAESLRQIKIVNDEFTKAFGDRIAGTIEPKDIREFLSRPTWGQVRKLHVLKALRSLFNWGQNEKLLHDNPANRTEDPHIEIRAPQVLKSDATKTLFEVTQKSYPEMLAFAAVTLFAGCRRSEAFQLTWDDIDLAEKTIRIPAIVSKTGVPRFTQLNDTALAWLNACTNKTGRIINTKKETAGYRAAVGIKGKRNILRKSFISCEVARTQDINTSAFKAGTSPKMIREHYLGAVSPNAALAHFSILPPAA